ncbi:MAG: hypothetical protein ACR2PX_00130 [Endozoicomonas sp.]|uniref:hypothetical protein n=1 Tax=Endozoicomonas sp. TaxID=1892382 RepID=UPI003D9B2258
MATSAVRFSGNHVFIKDSDLENWLQAITVQFQELIESGEDVEWLLVSCKKWCDIYENLPPGLKDIELDEVLRDEGRKLLFKRLLELTESLESEEGGGVVAKGVSGKILKGLFSR